MFIGYNCEKYAKHSTIGSLKSQLFNSERLTCHRRWLNAKYQTLGYVIKFVLWMPLCIDIINIVILL